MTDATPRLSPGALCGLQQKLPSVQQKDRARRVARASFYSPLQEVWPPVLAPGNSARATASKRGGEAPLSTEGPRDPEKASDALRPLRKARPSWEPRAQLPGSRSQGLPQGSPGCALLGMQAGSDSAAKAICV